MINNHLEKNLSCLILFGSHARGDNDQYSDLDLLGIDDNQHHTVRDYGKVNFSLYSSTEAIEMVKRGDLFFLHIIREGKCIYNEEFFLNLQKEFKFKKSYFEEASIAHFLGENILKNEHKIKNWAIANKRISWCVRTILISESADIRLPVFSKIKLSKVLSNKKFSDSDSLYLIDAKSKKNKDSRLIILLNCFLEQYQHLKTDNKKGYLYSQSIVSSTLEKIISTKPYLL